MVANNTSSLESGLLVNTAKLLLTHRALWALIGLGRCHPAQVRLRRRAKRKTGESSHNHAYAAGCAAAQQSQNKHVTCDSDMVADSLCNILHLYLEPETFKNQ